ncbi:DUF5050 domain-containing protein [Alkalibacterium sp.]|nr:MAG: DUF5050 domain-containing protein [Alkalibacterium sp.]
MNLIKIIELLLRSLLFLLLPAYIVLNGLYYLMFGHIMNLEWVTLVSYVILIGTLMYKRYKPISQEERLDDYSFLNRYLQSGRWEILQDNHSYTTIRPAFDTPLNLVVDDKVTIEKNRNLVRISGPQLYVTDLFKHLHNSDDEKNTAWFKPFRLAFAAVVLTMPLVRDSGLIWEWTAFRHNLERANAEVEDFDGNLNGNTVSNLNTRGLGIDAEDFTIYMHDDRTLVKTDNDLNFQETITFPQTSFGFGHLNLAGDWLYFTNGETLQRMKMDGSSQETLFDHGYVTHVHLTENGLYFLNSADRFTVHRMDFNGANLERVVNVENAYDLSVYEDVMYVSHRDGIDRYSLDGEHIEQLTAAKAWSITRQEDYYYFKGEDQRLYRLSENSPGQEEVVLDVEVDHYILADSTIFYMTSTYSREHPYSGVYKADLEGLENERLYVTDYIRHLTHIGDSIIFDASSVYGAVDVRRYDLSEETVDPLYN